MELLFIVLFGIAIGLGIRYLFPHPNTHGVMLIPAIGGIVAAVVWVGLTWLGWAWDGGWIWVVTLVAAAILTVVATLLLTRLRFAADGQRLVALGA